MEILWKKLEVFPSVYGRFREVVHGQPMGSIGLIFYGLLKYPCEFWR